MVFTAKKSPTEKQIDTSEAFTTEVAANRQMNAAEQHTPVMRAMGLAYYWKSLLETGKFDSISATAAAEGFEQSPLLSTHATKSLIIGAGAGFYAITEIRTVGKEHLAGFVCALGETVIC